MSRSNQRRIDPEVVKAARQRSLKRIGRVSAFVLFSGLTVAAALWLNQRWSVTHWQIDAEAPIRTAIAAELEAMQNRDFMNTQPQHLSEQWLAKIPDLATVRITRKLPDALHIEAQERVPVALWQDEQGRLHLYDGTPYRLLKRGESPDLPLLRVSEKQLAAAQAMMDALGSQELMPLDQLSEIRAGSNYWHIYFSHGVSWLVPEGGEAAVIGQLSTLMEQPRWRNRHWRVDARLASRWFIRPAGRGGMI